MEGQEIIEVKPLVLPTVNENDDALEIIQRRNAIFEKLLPVALAATNYNDWKDMDGKPYLEVSGCEKAARRFAISITDVKSTREDLEDKKGKYYLYTFTGVAKLGNETVEAIGTCSSRNKFFGSVKGVLKSVQDVDIANIKKTAYTNLFGNAVRKLLGLNNLTWEMVKQYGVSLDRSVTKIDFDKGASKAAETNQARLSETSAKKPFWLSNYNGKEYVNARSGQHFTAEFLTNVGLRAGKKEGTYYAYASPEILEQLENEFLASEERFGMKLQ